MGVVYKLSFVSGIYGEPLLLLHQYKFMRSRLIWKDRRFQKPQRRSLFNPTIRSGWFVKMNCRKLTRYDTRGLKDQEDCVTALPSLYLTRRDSYKGNVIVDVFEHIFQTTTS